MRSGSFPPCGTGNPQEPLLLRAAVVDDPGRDQDNEVLPIFRVRLEAEELTDDREAPQQRDARRGSWSLSDRQAADDRGFAVVHEKLVVGLLLRKMKPRSAAASGRTADRSVWSCISTWRLLVTCGVTVSGYRSP